MTKLKNCGDKGGLGYVNNIEILINGETIFIKGKQETPNPVASFNTLPWCSILQKIGHTQGKCYSRLFDRCQFHLNKPVSELNLKN